MPGIFAYDHMCDLVPKKGCKKSKDGKHRWKAHGYKEWRCAKCKQIFQQ